MVGKLKNSGTHEKPHHQDNKNYSLKAKFDKLFQHLS